MKFISARKSVIILAAAVVFCILICFNFFYGCNSINGKLYTLEEAFDNYWIYEDDGD